MKDEMVEYISWMKGWLEPPLPDHFEPATPEHAVLTRFKEGWGNVESRALLEGLTADFGETAAKAIEEFCEIRCREEWQKIGENECRQGSELDDFIRTLWGPLEEIGFRYSLEKDEGRADFRVTDCPYKGLAERSGLHSWVYRLVCMTDFYMPSAFSPKIEFKRTKTLVQGDECCNHCYSLKER